MLTIFCNNKFKPEKEYICKVLLNEFLGIEYQIRFEKKNYWLITDELQSRSILLPDILFQTSTDKWLTQESLPDQPIKTWDIRSNQDTALSLVDNHIPVIYGDMNNTEYDIPVDIFGSSFFMLTRYEEIVKPSKDIHGRFPASKSLAFRESFLNRPIVNEYLEILWKAIKRTWPQLKKKKKKFRVLPTHDVDIPFDLFFKTPKRMALKLAGDLFLRNTPSLFSQNILNWFKVKKNIAYDPFNTFDLIMDISEQNNLFSTFYFMTGGTTNFDHFYPIEDPMIKKIIKNIKQRKHKIGFHPSYATAIDEKLWQQELDLFKKSMNLYNKVEVRQHFLRFQVCSLYKMLNKHQISSDSSISFADYPGFRSGVCYEYTLFDTVHRTQLKTKEKPLIFMESTIIDERYMNLGATEKAYSYMLKLKNLCKAFNGDFVFLWHNNRLLSSDELALYKKIISG